MEKKFNFNNLIVLDLANNHQGDMDHAKMIIDNVSSLKDTYKIENLAIKFQFRDLPDFISKTEQKDPQNKHVPRFLSTKLEWSEYRELSEYIKSKGILTMCTPFDESSVDHIIDMEFDLIKIASCSANDWPLVEKVTASNLPIVASTGGLVTSEVDDLVSYFRHKGADFSLMHCVAIYPTPDEYCNLRNIQGFIERYGDITIGWSTHEPPDDTLHVGLAYALGARMFERHIGEIDNKKNIELNAYSSSKDHLNNWLSALTRSQKVIGSKDRLEASSEEINSLSGLQRGVFARKSIQPGKKISSKDVYFAFPLQGGQLSSGKWKEGGSITKAIKKDQPLVLEEFNLEVDKDEILLKKAVHEVKALLTYAHVPLSHNFTTEYSHHYGIQNFREVGAVLINVINRDYCKKILVQLAGQRHPSHYHKLKEETFLVIWGELKSVLDGKEKILKPGDTLMVPPGVWHSFSTETGCVFEEISTTAFSNDSVYKDDSINKLTSGQRKTIVDHWGRFQITEQLRRAKINS